MCSTVCRDEGETPAEYRDHAIKISMVPDEGWFGQRNKVHLLEKKNAENPVLRSLLHGNACYAGKSRYFDF